MSTVVAALALALVLAACPADITPDIGWEAEPGTNEIDITFFAPVSGLTADNFLVTDATGGTVILGTLSGRGRHWVLPIIRSESANLRVSIDASGISSQVVPVNFGANTTNDWSAARGAAGDGQQHLLIFTFQRPILDLQGSQISVLDGTGRATIDTAGLHILPAVIGGPAYGQRWAVPITVQEPGDVRVYVNRPGVVSGGTELYYRLSVHFITATATVFNANIGPLNAARTVAIDILFTGDVGVLAPANFGNIPGGLSISLDPVAVSPVGWQFPLVPTLATGTINATVNFTVGVPGTSPLTEILTGGRHIWRLSVTSIGSPDPGILTGTTGVIALELRNIPGMPDVLRIPVNSVAW